MSDDSSCFNSFLINLYLNYQYRTRSVLLIVIDVSWEFKVFVGVGDVNRLWEELLVNVY